MKKKQVDVFLYKCYKDMKTLKKHRNYCFLTWYSANSSAIVLRVLSTGWRSLCASWRAHKILRWINNKIRCNINKEKNGRDMTNMIICYMYICMIPLKMHHTLSPVEIFDLPSASLADKEPIPKDGSTAKHQWYSINSFHL